MGGNERHVGFASPWLMLVSAAVLAYFGFSPTFSYTSGITGKFLFFVALYEWTLQGAAMVFVASGVVAFVRPVVGAWMYGTCGLLAAIGLALAGILDLLDSQHVLQDPFLTFLFAALIAVASGATLRDAVAARSVSD